MVHIQTVILGNHEERKVEQDSEQTPLKVDVSGWSSSHGHTPLAGTGQGTSANAPHQDDIDDLVQWTRELDEQKLMDT